MAKCGMRCEVYSRIVGYFRPVSDWNEGKKAEFEKRKTFNMESRYADTEERREQERLHKEMHEVCQ